MPVRLHKPHTLEGAAERRDVVSFSLYPSVRVLKLPGLDILIVGWDWLRLMST